RESARQLELLYETSRLLSATWTLDELLPEVANNLAKIVDATSCFIVLRDPTSGELLQTAADSAHHARYRQLHIRSDEPSLSAEVIRRREPVGVEDLHNSAYANPRIAVQFPTQSLLGLPLIHRGEILGAILIGESRRQRRFTPDEIARLQGLVQQVAAEIANAQSVERERRQAADLAILNRVSTAVAASLDPTEVCRLIVNQIRQTTDYEIVSVYLLEGDLLRLQAAIGFDRTLPELPLERGVLGRTARTGEPILLTDVATDPDFIADASNVASEVCAPIRLGDETLGVINVETRAPRRLDRRDLNLLIAIAAQIAVTLRNAQLFEQTRRHGEGLSFLYKTANAVAATLDYAQIMHVVGDGLMRSLGMQRCVLSRWDRRNDCVVTLGAYALDDAHLFIDTDELGLTYALDTYPATRRLLETQEVMQVQADDPDAPAEEVDFIRQMGYASVLALPLVTPTGVFGMIELYSRDKRRFKLDEVSRSLAVANLTATALERERLFDAERRSRQVTETLLDVARAMGSLLDPDQLLGLILDQLRSLIPYVSGSIALLDSGRCEVRASHGLPASLADQPLVFDIAATPTVRRLVTTRRPYRIADTHANPDWLIFESFEHIRAWLGVPLIRNERVIGCLMIDHTEPGFFTEDHERLAEAFAQHAAIAIENTRLLEQTRRRAERERLVRDISGKVSASIEIDTVMQTAVDELGRALKPSRCLIRTGADAAYMPVAYEFCQAGIPGLGIGSLEHLPMLKTALSERQTVVDLEPRLLCHAPVQSGLVTPIFIRGRVAGVLALHQCDYPRRWTFEEVALIEEVGGQLGIAIDNAKLYQEATHSLSDLNLLHSIAMTVASAASLPEAVQRVVESVHADMRHSYIGLLLVEPGSGDLLVSAAIGYPLELANMRIPAGQGVTGWVARTGRPALVPDTRADPRFIDGSGNAS
ncbi:MAG TPA: GAF domain-containing protein, partial [Anaerolineae bacterium]|nr:GAF domain-containing protein [Anaerolineae bacterium]